MADATEDKDHAEDIENAAVIPALYSDTYWLTVWSGHIRLTFGEQLADKARYRSALVMDWDDALSLAKDIVELVERRKKRDAEQKNVDEKKAE